MKVVTWNVNGIRAAMKKDFHQSFASLRADVLCLQETKAQDDQVQEALDWLKGYYIYSFSAEKKGYSGTAIISKIEPLKVSFGVNHSDHDDQGRVVTAEYKDFYVVNVYTPNSGAELKRLGYRQTWDKHFLSYLRRLEKHKPVITCGDFNVAHREIDLARPKENYNKSAGYMQEEIDGFDALENAGFIDTWRYQHPKTVKYSWWSLRGGARSRNVGWRIDYVLVSPPLKNRIQNTEIYNDIHGSDHCPVSLTLK
jgi:exodeoxyribonuclease III